MTSDDLGAEHEDLLQFLYQFPVGVIDMNDAGVVSTMNPAASRMLSTETEPGESVVEPLQILERLAPELFDKVRTNPDVFGMITTGRGHDIDSTDGVTRFTVSVHRVRSGRIVVSLTDVTEERRLLNEQRARARRLQSALLGRIDLTDLDVSVAYRPAHDQDLSGGDWYDVIDVGEQRFALVVGDVVGHDIEASATMGQLRAIVRALALVDPDPVSVIERTENLARTITGALGATVHYALLDRSDSTVTYTSAGHPPALVIQSDGTAEFLANGRRPVLAAVNDSSPRSATRVLDPDDVLVIYSDGLIERRGESIDEGLERLRSTAEGLGVEGSVDELVDRLTRAMLTGTNQRDDVCMLAVRQRQRDEDGGSVET